VASLSTVTSPDKTAIPVGAHTRRKVSPGFSRLPALWHLTSLDAPTVAVTWAVAFAWAEHVRLPVWVLAILALAAWTSYVGDRLLDALRARHPLRDRHHFHWRHRRILVPLAVTAFLVAIGLVLLYMPIAARNRNSVLAVAALAYFTGVHSGQPAAGRLRLPRIRPANFPVKEMLVGVIFTLACAVPAWTRMNAHRVEMIAPVIGFMALAWLNCRAIEVWESVSSRSDSRPNGIFRLALILALSLTLAAVVAGSVGSTHNAALLATGGVSAALIGALDRNQHRLSAVMLRTAADLVLLTPLALLAFA